MTVLLDVLIVEDNEDDALLLLRELKKGNFQPRSERVESRPEVVRHRLFPGFRMHLRLLRKVALRLFVPRRSPARREAGEPYDNLLRGFYNVKREALYMLR